MRTIKSFRGEINSRCFLTVLLAVKKPVHLIEFRRGEVQYFLFNHKTSVINEKGNKKDVVVVV